MWGWGAGRDFKLLTYHESSESARRLMISLRRSTGSVQPTRAISESTSNVNLSFRSQAEHSIFDRSLERIVNRVECCRLVPSSCSVPLPLAPRLRPDVALEVTRGTSELISEAAAPPSHSRLPSPRPSPPPSVSVSLPKSLFLPSFPRSLPLQPPHSSIGGHEHPCSGPPGILPPKLIRVDPSRTESICGGHGQPSLRQPD
jgi:hypothetical protein